MSNLFEKLFKPSIDKIRKELDDELAETKKDSITGKAAEQIKHITLRYADTITNMEIPDSVTATENTLHESRKVILEGGIESILSRQVTVILIAPKDIDTGKIIEGIDDILNPVKVSVSDCKFYNFE